MHYINEPDNAVKAREILKLVYLYLSQLLLRLPVANIAQLAAPRAIQDGSTEAWINYEARRVSYLRLWQVAQQIAQQR